MVHVTQNALAQQKAKSFPSLWRRAIAIPVLIYAVILMMVRPEEFTEDE